MTPAPELVPCRVGVAYVSLRVTPQSTARTVVLEVLPLLGRQVCVLGPPCLAWWPRVGLREAGGGAGVRAGPGLMP